MRTIRVHCFKRVHAQDRIEGCRQVRVLTRNVEPFGHLSLPDSRYRLLKGENRHLHYIAIAEAIADELKRNLGIEVILGLGGLWRGFGDAWSDIDIAVLGRGRTMRKLWRGERWFNGYSIEVFPVDLNTAPSHSWDASRRQAFLESIVLFSRTRTLITSLRSVVKLGRAERKARIRDMLIELGWCGFHPQQWSGRNIHGYTWCLPPDLWVRRGSIATAHATIDHALDLTLQLLFLVNDRLPPDLKWRRYLVDGLPWLPLAFQALLARTEAERRNEIGFYRRAAATLELIQRIANHLEKTGDIRGNLYRAYLGATPDY